MIRCFLLICLMLGFSLAASAQCNVLRQQRSVTFNTDGECAPVDVTDFTIEYTFSIAQNPADIAIVFYWNDGGSNVDRVDQGSGLIASPDNKSFKATATFTYVRDANCLFTPQAFIEVAGIECETSEQEQFVSAWDNDDNFGGTMAVTPNPYNVCFESAISGAVFMDNSTFNCNPTANADNPNELTRNVQFVYGTNHNPANSIRNLTLVDGSVLAITDNTGALTSSTTRNGVTAAYFGPIETVPFPATAPTSESFPISAPSNSANVVGSTFEVTMYNWNTCNPWNGSTASPNYSEAVSEKAYITIVNPPVPAFQSRFQNASGAIQTVFCIGEAVYFQNQTAGAYSYLWEFFDDATGTTSLGTSAQTNPTFTFNTSGQKLIRLSATDGTVQGTCTKVFESLIELSPSAIANIQLFESTFTTPTDASFCQDGATTFTVGFHDATTGIEADTRFRMEFYDESNTLIESIPAGAGTYTSTNVPIADFTRDVTSAGATFVKLIARNVVTQCESSDMDTIAVYTSPQASFATDSVCAGSRTLFRSIADSVASLSPRVNQDRVSLYEWDFSYDGTTFNSELSRTNDDDFSWYLDGTNITPGSEPSTSQPGTYRVALRMTTEKGACVGLFEQDVTVSPVPQATLSSTYTTPICPGESVTFTNGSVNTGLTMTYALEVGHAPSGYLATVPVAATTIDVAFPNPNDTLRTYRAVLIATTSDGCSMTSSALFIQVLPDEISGFDDPAYNPQVTTCSPWASTFLVDATTQSLNADAYTWSLYQGTTLQAGYPVTKVSGDTDFHTLDYEVVNTGATIQTYSMILEASKSGVCISNDTVNVLISPQPDATFTVIQADNCQDVTFEMEAARPGLANYEWTFDPAPATSLDDDDFQRITYERQPVTGSDYTVTITLVTLNLANCPSDTVSQQVTVAAREPDVVADFTLSEDTIQLPVNTVSIQNTSTPGGSYVWDFGDGSTSTDFQPGSHSYTRFGAYEIELTATSGFCDAVATYRVVVLPADAIIDFEANELEGCSPLTVRFTNKSQFAESGKYIWEFGDGSISKQDEPTYTYFQDGLFSVRLRGQNEIGTIAESEITDYIHVHGLPYADFLASPRVVYIPTQEVFFSNLSQNAVSYLWDFGDGETSTEENPRHSYSDEGLFDITLIVENGFGCIDTLFRETEIRAVKGGNLASPNAFTPDPSGPSGGDIGGGENGDPDRINDVFLPRLEGVTRFRMLIFNKWGQLLFESKSQTVGWDGYYRGQLAPAGVYLYKLELEYSSGQELVKVGDVTLIR